MKHNPITNVPSTFRAFLRGAVVATCIGGVGLLSACSERTAADAAGSSFCAQLDDSSNLAQSLGDPATDSQKVADAFERLAELAPAEIRSDVQLVSDAMITLVTAPTDSPDAVSAAVDTVLSPEVTAATERVGQYAVDSCGIVPSEFAK